MQQLQSQRTSYKRLRWLKLLEYLTAILGAASIVALFTLPTLNHPIMLWFSVLLLCLSMALEFYRGIREAREQQIPWSKYPLILTSIGTFLFTLYILASNFLHLPQPFATLATISEILLVLFSAILLFSAVYYRRREQDWPTDEPKRSFFSRTTTSMWNTTRNKDRLWK